MNYCDVDDLYLAFGESNITKWADVNNDNVSADIDARIVWACESATEQINDRLRHGPYDIPITVGSGEELPRSLVRMTAYLAAAILYEARSKADTEEAGEGNLRWAEKKVDKWCRDIMARIVRLDLDIVTTDHPFVVEDDDDDDVELQQSGIFFG